MNSDFPTVIEVELLKSYVVESIQFSGPWKRPNPNPYPAICDKVLAMLAAHPPASAGMVSVPVEPTIEMLSVMVNLNTPIGTTAIDALGLAKVWQAMIEAAVKGRP